VTLDNRDILGPAAAAATVEPVLPSPGQRVTPNAEEPRGLRGICAQDTLRCCCCCCSCCCCQGEAAAATGAAPSALRRGPSVPLPVLLCREWRETLCRAARVWKDSSACLTVPLSALASPTAPAEKHGQQQAQSQL
jgi:hypothetical protein